MLRDIKPDESIPLEIYILGLSLIIILGLISYFTYKYFKRKNIMLNKIKKLKKIKNQNRKEFAYLSTQYLKKIDENHPLIQELEKYKYKKNVPEIDEELANKIIDEIRGKLK